VLSPSDCEREIETLHDLFVRWYRGEAKHNEFERLERALGDSFEMVSPDGSVSDRETVLDSIRSAYGTRTGFDIEIRNVELVERVDEHALVRYEEWQYAPAETAGETRESAPAETAGDIGESSSAETADETRGSSPAEKSHRTGRLSTVLLAPVGDAVTTRDETDPATRPVARWQYLQETWLDRPDT